MKKIITLNSDEMIKASIDLEQWKENNKAYLVSTSPDANQHTHGKLFFDFEKYIKLKGPEDWVKKYGKYICFEESRLVIESIHTIEPDSTEDYQKLIDEAFLNGNNKERLSVSDLEKRGYNFNSESYANYMILELKNNRLSNAVIGSYNKEKFCFSYPFFKSILKNNNETNHADCFFNFVEISMHDKKVLAFFVEFSNKDKPKKYYDYSQNPPKKYDSIRIDNQSNSTGNQLLIKFDKLQIDKFQKFKGLEKQL